MKKKETVPVEVILRIVINISPELNERLKGGETAAFEELEKRFRMKLATRYVEVSDVDTKITIRAFQVKK